MQAAGATALSPDMLGMFNMHVQTTALVSEDELTMEIVRSLPTVDDKESVSRMLKESPALFFVFAPKYDIPITPPLSQLIPKKASANQPLSKIGKSLSMMGAKLTGSGNGSIQSKSDGELSLKLAISVCIMDADKGNTVLNEFLYVYESGLMVKTLIDKILELAPGKENADGGDKNAMKDYGLFYPLKSIDGSELDDGIWLRPKRKISTYGLLHVCECTGSHEAGGLLPNSCPQKDSHPTLFWKLKPVLVDAVIFPSLLSRSIMEEAELNQTQLSSDGVEQVFDIIGEQKMALEVSPNLSAEALIATFLRKLGVISKGDPEGKTTECGLFFPQHGCWLTGGDLLVDVVRKSRQQHVNVHIKMRPVSIPITLCMEIPEEERKEKEKEREKEKEKEKEKAKAELKSSAELPNGPPPPVAPRLIAPPSPKVPARRPLPSTPPPVPPMTAKAKSADVSVPEIEQYRYRTEYIDVDLTAPFSEGTIPRLCKVFDISESGLFRLDAFRLPTLEALPKSLGGFTVLVQTKCRTTDSRAGKRASSMQHLGQDFGLRQTQQSGDKLNHHTFDLSKPLASQHISTTDVLVLQYSPPDNDDDDGEGVNIWEEPPSSSENVTYEAAEDADGEPVLTAATLNKLVEALTNEEKVDTNFFNTFLLTYQSFTTADIFLNKLMQRFNVPPNNPASGLSDADYEVHVQMPIRMRVCNVLRKWIEQCYDDLGDELISRIGEFATNMEIEKSCVSLSKIIHNALKKFRGRNVDFYSRQFNVKPPPVLVPRNLYDDNFTILDVEEEEIARQIAIIDFDHFRSIKSAELLNQAWAKSKLQYRARNVLKMISWFNHLSKLVALLILRTESLKSRVKVVQKLLQIAKLSRQYNNFGAVMGIISGFNNAAVLRLKLTFSQLPKKWSELQTELEEMMSSQGSYRNYRGYLGSANPPVIPYMGVHLSDLVFIEDGNPDKLGGLINFEKRRLVCKVITQLQSYQQNAYNLEAVPRIIQVLSKPINETDDNLYQLSLEREPRGMTKPVKK